MTVGRVCQGDSGESVPRDRQRPGAGWEHVGQICPLPRLGQAPEVRVWDRREAGGRGEGWGHAEQRLGFGGEPSAPDPWGWEQLLCRCCLACCPSTSLFSFPPRCPGALLARSLSGKPILSAGPQTAHSFVLISSLRLQAHVLTVRREGRPWPGVMQKGAQAGLLWVWLCVEAKGHRGEEGAPLRLGGSPVPSHPENLDCFPPPPPDSASPAVRQGPEIGGSHTARL